MAAEDLPVDHGAARVAVLSATRFASVAAIGGLFFGYDISVTNRAVKALQANFHIGNAVLGFAASSAVMGAAVGAVLAGRIADRMGRLAMMKLSAVLFLICGLGAGLAGSIWTFVIFHTIGGLGIGLSSVAAPAYIAEISPPRLRGRLGSLQQLAIVCGICGALALTWLPFHLAGGSSGQLWLVWPRGAGPTSVSWCRHCCMSRCCSRFRSHRVISLHDNELRRPAGCFPRCWVTATWSRR